MAKGDRTPSGGYSQDWAAYNAARRNRKRHFRLLLRELADCVEQPEQPRGRPRLRLADIVFCVVFKIYTTYDSRAFMGDADDAHDFGLLGHVPHFNTLSRYLRFEWLTPVLERLVELSSLPLVPFEADFAVDATGFSTDRYARRLDARTQEESARREWVKMHLICGVRTHVVTSVIVSPGHESRFFGRLVAATARNFRMEEVSADAGYISGENTRQALMVGAVPFIPFRSNCRVDAGYRSEVWKRLLTMFREEHWRFLAHYNKRNNVETVFSMIKANFGGYLRGRDERARINEVLAKVLCHNLCVLIQAVHELGIEPRFDAVVSPAAEAAKEDEKPASAAGCRLAAGAARPAWPGKDRAKGRSRKGRAENPDQLQLFVEN